MNTKFNLFLMTEPFWKVKHFSSDKTLCIEVIFLIMCDLGVYVCVCVCVCVCYVYVFSNKFLNHSTARELFCSIENTVLFLKNFILVF